MPLLESFLFNWEVAQYVLCFDGKLLRQGLTKEGGDVDMGGVEKGPLLSEKEEQLNNETGYVDDLIQKIDCYSENEELSAFTNVEELRESIASVIQKLTIRIRDVKQKNLKTEIRLDPYLMDKIGGNRNLFL